MRDDKRRVHGRGGAQGATGEPAELVQNALRTDGMPQSPDAVRQLEDVFGPLRRRERPVENRSEEVEFDYDDVVQQSFPASDPPPPRG